MTKPNFEMSRITEVRDLMKYSQKDFAEKIGITQGALSQIESGKSHASFDTIKKISDEFNVNCNWLIKGIGKMQLNEPGVEVLASDKSSHRSEKAFIPLIKEEAHAGYVKGHGDMEYIKSLDVYQIPGFEKGNYRLFEIVGDSMIPTLYPGEIIVCEFMKDHEKIESNSLCVVISKEGIIAKRVFYYQDGHASFILKSDNPNYKTYSLKVNEVLEVWIIRAKITSLFADSTNMDGKRIERLEADLSDLKTQVDELKKRDV